MTRPRRTAAQLLADSLSEVQWQANIIEYAHLKGWMVAHFRPGLNMRGKWQTAVAGDGAGFPDLVLVRERVVFIEVKAHWGRLSPEQVAWKDCLQGASAEWYCWEPRDRAETERTLA